jgi:DNA-binding SARP family transcriptional activator
MIKVSVLGEFQASYDGRVIPLQPMQSIVISALLCAGELVFRDRLAELVWNPPTRGSDKTLRTHLSRIDKSVEAVGGDPEKFVVSVPMVGGRRGYRLAEGLDIDAVQFRQLVAAGCEALRQERFETADAALAEALSLRKRGQPLLQAENRPFAVVYVERLEEDYKNVVIGSFKTGITLGRHREVAGELPRFAHRWPGERELQTIYVHALYRSNREEEAVVVCRQAIGAARAAGIDERPWLDLQRDVLRGVLPRSGPLVSPAPAAA